MNDERLSKIRRLKALRRDIAEREYRAAKAMLDQAENAAEQAGAMVGRRISEARDTETRTVKRIFAEPSDKTQLNAQLAVAAHLQAAYAIRKAREEKQLAEAAVAVAATVSDEKRTVYAARQRGEQKIGLMEDRLQETRLRETS